MRVRNLDRNGDWQFGHSQLDYNKDLNAITADIQMRLKEFWQDCFFNMEQGIDWLMRLGSHNQKELLDLDIINTVKDVEGVLNVFNFTSSVTGRRYICQFDVYTTFSTESTPINFESEF